MQDSVTIDDVEARRELHPSRRRKADRPPLRPKSMSTSGAPEIKPRDRAILDAWDATPIGWYGRTVWFLDSTKTVVLEVQVTDAGLSHCAYSVLEDGTVIQSHLGRPNPINLDDPTRLIRIPMSADPQSSHDYHLAALNHQIAKGQRPVVHLSAEECVRTIDHAALYAAPVGERAIHLACALLFIGGIFGVIHFVFWVLELLIETLR